MKKIMASLVAIAALVGCSKSDDNGGGISISEGTFPKKIVNKGSSGNVNNETIYNLQGGKILSTTFISYKPDGDIERKSLISASYEGDYPKEITHTESITNGEKKNYTETYSFVDGKLKTTIKKYDNSDRATTTTYSYHNDGKLAKVLFEEPGNAGQNGQIEKITFVTETDYTHTGNVISAAEKTYTKDAQGNKRDGDTSLTIYTYTFENENLIKVTKSTTGHESTTEYTYDGKNNPNLQNFIKLVNPNYFISTSGSKNNILTQKTTYKGDHNNANPYVSEYVYEYTYADNNYPLTEKIFRKTTENGLEKKELDLTTEYTY
ncbi:hypothetical protein CGC50_04740 [Capnocytophaga gingivalis]|uniref:Sugar-binding protein n=1 Tax=Capnocytophaga gingivalis TaxID=1017 RepID=A0A250FN26_9FLAO|nr:hypothetical protein [Capnocytophaga gingivalis]ATA86530.1 hypothetical protein CGC50_04740 [Capnocytophaga gingivalis]